ncbi:MAG: EamA family transporter, partial [Promethearchaeota archaeon]
MRKKILLLYFELIFMIVMWSFSFVIVDIAVEFIPPLSIAFYRFIIASFTFLIIDIYLKLRKNKKSVDKEKNEEYSKFQRNDWILITLASFTGISIFFLAQYT